MFYIRNLFLTISFLCSALISLGESIGNITSLMRNGLQNGGTCGKVNQPTYGYDGNRLVSVSDAVTSPTYNGFFGFNDGANQAVEYEYDANGNMTRDRNKGISSIDYDLLGNIRKITLSGGTVDYVYSAGGTRLRTVRSIRRGNVVLKDSTDYCGNLLLKNGAPYMYRFPGGYISFSDGMPSGCHYYIEDYLGNVRMVVDSNDRKEQVTHYYPYGGVIGGIAQNAQLQPYKFGGNEFERTCGLDWYDIHARQYDPIVPSWNKIDPLAEENPEVSPYAYCHNNPINKIDPDGMDDYYSITGRYLSHEDNGTDFIIIRDQFIHELKQTYDMEWLKSDTPINEMTLSAEAYSNIFTDILSKMDGVNVNELYNGKVSVTVWEQTENIKNSTNYYNDSDFYGGRNADIGPYKNKQRLNAYIFPMRTEERNLYSTISNVQNLLGAHEYFGHYKQNLHGEGMAHQKVYEYQMKHSSWKRTTSSYKNYMIYVKNDRK